MATSTNYDELEYVWSEWRNAAGRTVRKQYIEYVDLNNKAAKANGRFLSLIKKHLQANN